MMYTTEVIQKIELEHTIYVCFKYIHEFFLSFILSQLVLLLLLLSLFLYKL